MYKALNNKANKVIKNMMIFKDPNKK